MNVRALVFTGLSFLAVGCQQDPRTELMKPGETSRNVFRGAEDTDRAVGALLTNIYQANSEFCSATTLCVDSSKNFAVVLSASHCAHRTSHFYTVDHRITGGVLPQTYGTIVSRTVVGERAIPISPGSDGFALYKVRLIRGKESFVGYNVLNEDPHLPYQSTDSQAAIQGYGTSMQGGEPQTFARRVGAVDFDSWREAGYAKFTSGGVYQGACKGDSGGPIIMDHEGIFGVISGSGYAPVTKGQVAERCDNVNATYGMAVGPYFLDLREAANNIISGCIEVEPTNPNAVYGAWVHLADTAPSSVPSTARVRLSTSPKGTAPVGADCTYRINPNAELPGCVYATYYNSGNRFIRFEADLSLSYGWITGGYWIINQIKYDGVSVQFPFRNVKMEATFYPTYGTGTTPPPTPTPTPVATPTPTFTTAPSTTTTPSTPGTPSTTSVPVTPVIWPGVVIQPVLINTPTPTSTTTPSLTPTPTPTPTLTPTPSPIATPRPTTTSPPRASVGRRTIN